MLLSRSIESFDGWSSAGKQHRIIKHALVFQRLPSTNVTTFSLNDFALKCLLWPKIIQSSAWLTLVSHCWRCSISAPLRTDQQGICQQLFAYYAAEGLHDVCERPPSAIKYFFSVDLNPFTFTKLCFIKKLLVRALSLQFLIFYAIQCHTDFPLAYANIVPYLMCSLLSGTTETKEGSCSAS